MTKTTNINSSTCLGNAIKKGKVQKITKFFQRLINKTTKSSKKIIKNVDEKKITPFKLNDAHKVLTGTSLNKERFKIQNNYILTRQMNNTSIVFLAKNSFLIKIFRLY